MGLFNNQLSCLNTGLYLFPSFNKAAVFFCAKPEKVEEMGHNNSQYPI